MLQQVAKPTPGESDRVGLAWIPSPAISHSTHDKPNSKNQNAILWKWNLGGSKSWEHCVCVCVTLEVNEKSKRFPELHTETFQASRLPPITQCWHSVSLTEAPSTDDQLNTATKAPFLLRPPVAISVALGGSFLERISWSILGHQERRSFRRLRSITLRQYSFLMGFLEEVYVLTREILSKFLWLYKLWSLHANLCPLWSALERHRT